MNFLQLVAQDLLRRFPDGMQDVTVVFPGKRARLFLNKYIYEAAGHPVWAPSYSTIRELFASLSPYAPIERIEAICLLYKVFRRCMPESDETLDHFYSWGEVLLSDFDDIDKHLVRADHLFSNIEDLALLTSTNYISEEQERTLQHFFKTFDKATDESLREKFRQLWRAMPRIYSEFNDEMRRSGRLTEGALFRDVIERIGNEASGRTYAFVGFNALSTVEEKLLMHLKGEGRAIFYWDYDESYLNAGHEAGRFMERNLKMFAPNAIDGRHFRNLQHDNDAATTGTPHAKSRFTYVATAGSNIQARYIPQWLGDISYGQQHSTPETAISADTAIVLCDENMLEAVLHAIPDEAHGGPHAANITMGFPLVSTPVYGMVKALLTLHTDGWNSEARRLRSYERRIVAGHPLLRAAVANGDLDINVHGDGCLWIVQYIRSIVEYVARQAIKEGENRKDESLSESGDKNHDEEKEPEMTADEILLHESLFKVHNLLGTFEQLIENGTLQVEPARLAGIIDQEMKRMSIPFHGEPAQGLQVMGMLETRCLDFDNILMLSVGEGKIPKGSGTPSFIPYVLRHPFGLTTVEDRVAIEAYNFYRLLQRARNVTFVYDTSNMEGVKNEMSRFLRQMLVEMQFDEHAITIKPAITLPQPNILTAAKTPQVIDYLRCRKPFSPTALECYIQCPLKYYLQYVARIREYDEMNDEMDGATFGNIFHASAEAVYEADEVKENGGRLTKKYLSRLIDTVEGEATLRRIVNEKFYTYYLEKRGLPADTLDDSSSNNGALMIRRDVIVGYLKSLLRHDLRSIDECTREVFDCEREAYYHITLSTGERISTRIIIDRIDRVTDKDGTRLQVIDYKTMSRGVAKPPLKLSIDDVMAQNAKYVRHIFQTFIYSLCVIDQNYFDGDTHGGATPKIQPCVFYTQDAAPASYSPEIVFDGGTLTDFTPYADEFRERIRILIEEILNPQKPFTQTDKGENCAYCPFAEICRK